MVDRERIQSMVEKMCLKNPTQIGKDALLRNNLLLHLFGVATRSLPALLHVSEPFCFIWQTGFRGRK